MTEVIRRHSLLAYSGLTFLWSWGTALAILGPRLASGEPIPTWLGLMTFPSMILGPALAGVALTAVIDGRTGLKDLLSRMRRVRLTWRWYAIACLVAPAVLLVVLCGMALTISPDFAPGLFPLGVLFGPIAGFFEEIGWSGFAYSRFQQRYGAIGGGIFLGVIWGVWHLPVLDFMGAASPHGAYFPMFFAAFVATVTPVRVLIGMLSQQTRSVLLAQLMHASLTGSIALLSPAGMTPAQEAAWYAVYAATLWVVLAVVAVWRLRRAQPLAPPSVTRENGWPAALARQ